MEASKQEGDGGDDEGKDQKKSDQKENADAENETDHAQNYDCDYGQKSKHLFPIFRKIYLYRQAAFPCTSLSRKISVLKRFTS